MRIVTLEEHVLTPPFASAIRKFSCGPAAQLRARMEPALLDMGVGRIEAMDEAGITMQVLSLAAHGLHALPVKEALVLVADANDRIASAVAMYPKRFAGFAAIALADVDAAVAELYRAVETLHLSGVMLYGNGPGLLLDDERFELVWEAVEALQVPVYLYPATLPAAVEQAYYSGLSGSLGKLMSIAAWGWQAETGLHILRLIISGLFDRYPGLRLIIGNLGENLPASVAHAAGVLDQMGQRLERPVEEYFHRHFWVTTSGYFCPVTFAAALEVIGIERMLFSIDYPFGSTTHGREFLDSLALGVRDRARLTHENADFLLGKLPTNGREPVGRALNRTAG